jgi:hypothetical protein
LYHRKKTIFNPLKFIIFFDGQVNEKVKQTQDETFVVGSKLPEKFAGNLFLPKPGATLCLLGKLFCNKLPQQILRLFACLFISV